jgi:hypothetical protein
MTATKPTTSTPASSVHKKTVRAIKKAANVKFDGDASLQGIGKQRRYARRGSQTPAMLSLSASRLAFDYEARFSMKNLESETGMMTLVNALQLNIQKDSEQYLTPRSR